MIILRRISALMRKLCTIRPGLIVDIGAGNNPHLLSNIVVDRYIGNNTHRQGTTIETWGKILVKADLCQLPFLPKSIDYTICSHVLEHVRSPSRACRELSRVSRAGYIEVPTVLCELYFNRSDHLWLCSLIGDQLIFDHKPDGWQRDVSPMLEDQIAYDTSDWYEYYFSTIRQWLICLNWTGEIQVNQTQPDIPEAKLERVIESKRLVAYNRGLNSLERIVKMAVSKIFVRKPSFRSLEKVLMCISCGGKMSFQNDQYQCNVCSGTYLVRNSIIYVISENE